MTNKGRKRRDAEQMGGAVHHGGLELRAMRRMPGLSIGSVGILVSVLGRSRAVARRHSPCARGRTSPRHCARRTALPIRPALALRPPRMLTLPNLLTLSRIFAVPILVFLLWRPSWCGLCDHLRALLPGRDHRLFRRLSRPRAGDGVAARPVPRSDRRQDHGRRGDRRCWSRGPRRAGPRRSSPTGTSSRRWSSCCARSSSRACASSSPACRSRSRSARSPSGRRPSSWSRSAR